MRKKILTVVGARPQFIKISPVSRVIRSKYVGIFEEILVHTGQHYSQNMSSVFFDELNLPAPNYHLGITARSHGSMTGRMLEAIERVCVIEKPGWVLVYGDTNSTLAGALAASKLNIPVAHIEAGLRSFNKNMPEEINRILIDHVSSLHFCPTEVAIRNLHAEGIEDTVHHIGDVMYDVAIYYWKQAIKKSDILKQLQLLPKEYILVTCHRAENTNDRKNLEEILSAFVEVSKQLPVVFPLHPRTKNLIHEYQYASYLNALIVTEPLSFLDMLILEQSSRLILTDSGGVQKEAFFHKVPCITLRNETEWIETVESGWNRLVGASKIRILEAVEQIMQNAVSNIAQLNLLYGAGDAAEKIVSILADHH